MSAGKNAENKVVKTEEAKTTPPADPATGGSETKVDGASDGDKPGTVPLDPDLDLDAAAELLAERGAAPNLSTFAGRRAARLAREAAEAAAAADAAS